MARLLLRPFRGMVLRNTVRWLSKEVGCGLKYEKTAKM